MHQKEMHEGKIHRHLLCNTTTAASGFVIGLVGDYTRLRESNSIFHFYCYYLLCIIDQSGIHLSESNICLLPSATTNRQAALLSWEMSELRLYSHPSLQKKRVIEKITKYSFPSYHWHLEGNQWKTTLPFYKTVAGEEFPAYLIKLVNLTFSIPKTRYWWSPALHRPQRIKLLHWKLCETISLLCIFKRSRCQS